MISTSTQITLRILSICPTNVLSCATLDHSGWAWPLEKQCTDLHSPRNFQFGFSVCHQASPAFRGGYHILHSLHLFIIRFFFFTKNHDQLQNLELPERIGSQRGNAPALCGLVCGEFPPAPATQGCITTVLEPVSWGLFAFCASKWKELLPLLFLLVFGSHLVVLRTYFLALRLWKSTIPGRAQGTIRGTGNWILLSCMKEKCPPHCTISWDPTLHPFDFSCTWTWHSEQFNTQWTFSVCSLIERNWLCSLKAQKL